MDRTVVAGGVIVAAGGLVALQAPINATLGRAIGNVPASALSFGIGLVALIALTLLVSGGFGDLGELGEVPWWAFLGGLLGAVYVTSALIAVSTLGAGGVTAATIAGQLGASVVLDRMGAFGLEQRALSVPRMIGVALLAVGTILVVRD